VNVRIRTFLNTDTPTLTRLWNEHHQLAGIASQFSESAWEYSILGKIFFDEDGLFIAEFENVPIGFVHAVKLGISPDASNRKADGLINALCIGEHAEQDAVARQLITAAESYLASKHSQIIGATGSPDCYAYYLGVGDANGMLGISSRDVRSRNWFEQTGYRECASTESWQIALSSFRMPMDRMQIAIRRQGRIETVVDPSSNMTWWNSVIMGHSELFAFKLLMREPITIERQVDFWQPEIATLDGSSGMMQLMMPKITDQVALDQFAFLIAESLRHFQQIRIPRVRTTIYSDDIYGAKLLERLGFRKDFNGTFLIK